MNIPERIRSWVGSRWRPRVDAQQLEHDKVLVKVRAELRDFRSEQLRDGATRAGQRVGQH